MDRMEPHKPNRSRGYLYGPAEKRLDEELQVHRLYLDLARFERGER